MTGNELIDLRARLAARAGIDPDTEPVEVAADVLRRARWAQAHNEGHPNWLWSTGEQLAVALVLDDHAHLEAMDYTAAEAAERVAGGMFYPPADMGAWLAGIRSHLVA